MSLAREPSYKKNKDFEEIAQTMCMDFVNDKVWCIIDQVVPDMFAILVDLPFLR